MSSSYQNHLCAFSLLFKHHLWVLRSLRAFCAFGAIIYYSSSVCLTELQELIQARTHSINGVPAYNRNGQLIKLNDCTHELKGGGVAQGVFGVLRRSRACCRQRSRIEVLKAVPAQRARRWFRTARDRGRVLFLRGLLDDGVASSYLGVLGSKCFLVKY